jgi:hypothetical protein
MPKINWAGDDEDDALTADDVEGAEEGFQAYAGEIPPGGVYRFIIRRIKFKKASTGTKGLSLRLNLDGSWKSAHRKYDGCPLWDDVWMTKGSAAFVKALAQAIGVSAQDIIEKVVVDEDGYVTKIGRKVFEDKEYPVYIAVKRGEYNDEPRLEKAGTGFQVVEADAEPDEDEAEETPRPAKKAAKAAPAKAAAAKAGKGKNKGGNDDDEPPF